MLNWPQDFFGSLSISFCVSDYTLASGSVSKIYLFSECAICISTLKHDNSETNSNLLPKVSCRTHRAWSCGGLNIRYLQTVIWNCLFMHFAFVSIFDCLALNIQCFRCNLTSVYEGMSALQHLVTENLFYANFILVKIGHLLLTYYMKILTFFLLAYPA